MTSKRNRLQLDAMVEEATVDCYNEDEQLTGLFTMLEDNLVLPFQTQVLGVTVTVERVDLTASGQIVANCSRDRVRQTIPNPRHAPAGTVTRGRGVDRGVPPLAQRSARRVSYLGGRSTARAGQSSVNRRR